MFVGENQKTSERSGKRRANKDKENNIDVRCTT